MYLSLIQNTKLRAIGWMVLNCFMASSVLALVKFSSPHFSLSVLISSYHLIATIIMGLWLIYLRYSIRTKLLHLHFLRSLLGVVAYFLYFHALSITSMANVIALGYTDAILTCIFYYIFLKEPLGKTQIVNLILSFIGALLIIKPNAHIFNLGAMLAAISATLWALSNVLIKIIGKKDEAYLQLFYSNLFTFLLAGIVVLYNGEGNEIADSATHYYLLIALALIVSLQQFALFKSLYLANASIVMPFFVISVIFVHIYGYVFFGETQGLTEIIGTILVVAVGVLQIFRLHSK